MQITLPFAKTERIMGWQNVRYLSPGMCQKGTILLDSVDLVQAQSRRVNLTHALVSNVIERAFSIVAEHSKGSDVLAQSPEHC